MKEGRVIIHYCLRMTGNECFYFSVLAAILGSYNNSDNEKGDPNGQSRGTRET